MDHNLGALNAGTSRIAHLICEMFVQSELARMRGAIAGRLREKIVRAVDSGEMPGETDPEALAGLVMAVIQGLSTLARDGVPRDRLLSVAHTAMSAWPHDQNCPAR